MIKWLQFSVGALLLLYQYKIKEQGMNKERNGKRSIKCHQCTTGGGGPQKHLFQSEMQQPFSTTFYNMHSCLAVLLHILILTEVHLNTSFILISQLTYYRLRLKCNCENEKMRRGQFNILMKSVCKISGTYIKIINFK